MTHRFAIEDAMEAFRMAQYKSKGVLRVIVSPTRQVDRRRGGSLAVSRISKTDEFRGSRNSVAFGGVKTGRV
jgi:hypothetical protein